MATKVLKTLRILFVFFSIYLFVFIFSAGIVSAENSVSKWKEKESVIVMPDKVEIKGINRLTREMVLLVTGLYSGKSWFDIDERVLEEYVFSTAWVKKCTVKKTFPDSIRIVIEEFDPAIVVSGVKNKDDSSDKNIYAMWFADKSGVVFKKAFPGEIDDSLPFFHIDKDVQPKEEEKALIVKKAVAVADSLKKASKICAVKSIRYNATSQFSADCERADNMVTTIHLGTFEKTEELIAMSERFLNTALKLRKKNIWAGEYIFEGSGKERKIIVGKIIKNKERGSDA
jgi:hypothetical protein